MATGRGKGWALIALAVVVVLITGGIVGFRVALGVLKGKVVAALGPDSEIKDIRVGWFSLDVEELRIKAPSEWPAADALRAERLVIVPSLRSVLSRQIGVQSITSSGPIFPRSAPATGSFGWFRACWRGRPGWSSRRAPRRATRPGR